MDHWNRIHSFPAKHQLWICSEATLIVNSQQRCFNVDFFCWKLNLTRRIFIEVVSKLKNKIRTTLRRLVAPIFSGQLISNKTNLCSQGQNIYFLCQKKLPHYRHLWTFKYYVNMWGGGGKKGSFNSWHMLTVYCGGGRGTIILKNNRLNIERSWTLIFKGDCVQFWLDNSWKLNILPTSFFQQFQIQFSMFLMFHVSTSFNTYFLIYPHPLP